MGLVMQLALFAATAKKVSKDRIHDHAT